MQVGSDHDSHDRLSLGLSLRTLLPLVVVAAYGGYFVLRDGWLPNGFPYRSILFVGASVSIAITMFLITFKALGRRPPGRLEVSVMLVFAFYGYIILVYLVLPLTFGVGNEFGRWMVYSFPFCIFVALIGVKGLVELIDHGTAEDRSSPTVELPNSNDDALSNRIERGRQAVDWFWSYMEGNPLHGEIRDEKVLVVSKHELMHAFCVAIAEARDPEVGKALLELSMCVAYFQPGIGARPISPPARLDENMDFDKLSRMRRPRPIGFSVSLPGKAA